MANGITDRGLKSASELFGKKEHGTRYRYLAGCKCFFCRRANSDYERERNIARRNGDWNGLVEPDIARRHIRELSREGIGRRTLATQSGVSASVITEIGTGRKVSIRARTERKILAVVAIHQRGSTLVDAKETWMLINAMLAEGFTKARIATELGAATPALQIGKEKVTAETAKKVRALSRKYSMQIE